MDSDLRWKITTLHTSNSQGVAQFSAFWLFPCFAQNVVSHRNDMHADLSGPRGRPRPRSPPGSRDPEARPSGPELRHAHHLISGNPHMCHYRHKTKEICFSARKIALPKDFMHRGRGVVSQKHPIPTTQQKVRFG